MNLQPKDEVLFILNPVSGGGRAKKLPDVISLFCKQHHIVHSLVFSERPHHATQIAQEFVKNGGTRVVAAGGDGTIHEVARALIGTQTQLVILPVGSGNGLARHLKVSLKPEIALKALLKAEVRSIDTCEVNGRPFVMLAGLGFDAEIARSFAASETRGLATYAKLVLQSMRSYRGQSISFKKPDGQTQNGKYFLVNVANSTQFGNEFKIAPQASTRDGVMDVILVRPFPLWRSAEVALRMLNGTLHKFRFFDSFQTKEVTLRAQMPGINIDGEWESLESPYHFSIVPKSLWVRVG